MFFFFLQNVIVKSSRPLTTATLFFDDLNLDSFNLLHTTALFIFKELEKRFNILHH